MGHYVKGAHIRAANTRCERRPGERCPGETCPGEHSAWRVVCVGPDLDLDDLDDHHAARHQRDHHHNQQTAATRSGDDGSHHHLWKTPSTTCAQPVDNHQARLWTTCGKPPPRLNICVGATAQTPMFQQSNERSESNKSLTNNQPTHQNHPPAERSPSVGLYLLVGWYGGGLPV